MKARDPVTDYARRVVAGEFVTGRLVRLACERHLRDLEEGPARGLRWHLEEAAIAVEFWELCPHLKGEKAAAKESLRLEPWQVFVVGSLYGWKKADGSRRFRVAWCEMARKQGKTTLVYPAALYALALDGEEGAEVYSVATKRDQARLVYQLARRAVTRTPELGEVITPYAHSLVSEETFSTFVALGADADTLDGLNPSLAIADEVHKWRGRELWDVIETGMGARRQPLLWAITTAGEEGEQDVYGQEHNYTTQVLEGVILDDSRFGYIAKLDPEDEWTDPANFIKANPNLGVSVQAEEIGRAVEKAKNSPAAANAVKRLRLGIRSQDSAAWIPLQTWDAAADKRLSWDKLAGFACYAGLDLASSSDFAALALCFPLDGLEADEVRTAANPERPEFWGFVWRLWMPGTGVGYRESKLREIARPWVEGGFVVSTPGDVIDTDKIEADVIEASKRFNVIGLAFDPFNATQLAGHLATEGIDVAKFPQSMGSFAAPTREFEADLIAGKLRHDGNPAVRWMADNVVLVQNAAGHQMPSRKKSKNKIDGIVAGVMARGRAMAIDPDAERPSFYDTNGIEAF